VWLQVLSDVIGSKPKISQLVVQDVVKSYIGLTMNVLIVNARWRGCGMILAIKLRNLHNAAKACKGEQHNLSVHLKFVLPVKLSPTKNIPCKEPLTQN
jgi:hypothetical protein